MNNDEVLPDCPRQLPDRAVPRSPARGKGSLLFQVGIGAVFALAFVPVFIPSFPSQLERLWPVICGVVAIALFCFMPKMPMTNLSTGTVTVVKLTGRQVYRFKEFVALQLLHCPDGWELNLIPLDASQNRVHCAFHKQAATARETGKNFANLLNVPLLEHTAEVP